MQEINFTKMTGGGNDFITIDNINNDYSAYDFCALAKNWCRRGHSIGADGIIVVEKSDEADFYYKHINPDGSIAGICGNGSRCVSLFSYMNKIAGKKMKFETPVGIFNSDVSDDLNNVKVDFIPAGSVRLNIPVEVEGFSSSGHFILTGVPHVVFFVEEIENFPIDKIGKPIVYYKDFLPDGTNVNFIKTLEENNIRIRTYERGVNCETLACGTGSISSAIISGIFGKVKTPVKMLTQGGMILEIDYNLLRSSAGDVIGAENITMKGEAKLVYKGVVKAEN